MTFLNNFLYSLDFGYQMLLIGAVMMVIAVVTYKKSLTLSGVIGAFVLGFIVLYTTAFDGFFIMLFFFVSAAVVGKIGKKKKVKEVVIEKKHGARDWVQVFANGFFATLFSLLYYLTKDTKYLIIFAAALAEATADTWAGDIGRLSKKPPVSIRTFKEVPKGLSGGVTALGVVGGFAGSLAVGLIALWLFDFEPKWGGVSSIVLSGFVGCVIDSVLGAYVQVRFYDEKTGMLTEREVDEKGQRRPVAGGLRMFDNDMVNFVSNLVAVLVCSLMVNLL